MESTQSTANRGGRRSRGLTIDQIARLEVLRKRQRDWSWPQLKASMGSKADPCPFKLDTLLRAADGYPISEKNHAWLVKWLDAHLPAPALPQDGKSRAAGDDTADEPEESPESPANADSEKTHRGSR